MEENKNPMGEITGFDSADNGFYTKPKEDIIQDEVYKREPEPQPTQNSEYSEGGNSYTPPPQNEPPFQNNGYYGGYGSYTPPVKKEPKPKKRYGIGAVVLSAVLAAVIGAVAGITTAVPILISGTEVTTENGETVLQKVSINVDEEAGNIVEAVAQKATPSVVGIRTTTSVTNFFGGTSQSTGDGSGVVYSENGYIITNYHVISGAIGSNNSKIEVYLDSADSEGYNATVVGYNIAADLAVIKIDAKNLTAVELADSSKLKVGQYVITIGNPGGLEFMDSVTYGVISGLDRVVSSDSDVKLIQTDAAINPGNSGGALLNAEGKLVGINSSKIVSEEFEGMGFAIPSNTVKEICDKIIDRENSPEPYIGISISERYTADVLKYYGYPHGAVVLSVADGSPADKAGIAKGDIITQFGDTEITEYPVLEQAIMDSQPEQVVEVKLYRSGRYYTTQITVGSNNAVE